MIFAASPSSFSGGSKISGLFLYRLLGQVCLDLSDRFRFHIPVFGDFIADKEVDLVSGLLDQVDEGFVSTDLLGYLLDLNPVIR